MPIDFINMDPAEVLIRIVNAYQPDRDGPVYASFLVEDLAGEDSYLYLLGIPMEDSWDYELVYHGYVMLHDHVTVSAKEHYVLEFPNVIRTVTDQGLVRSLGSREEAALLRIWAGTSGAVYVTGEAMTLGSFTGDTVHVLSQEGGGLMRSVQVMEGDSFLACGDFGAVLERGADGLLSNPFDLPTTSSLRCILRAPDGTIAIGGEDGLALMIRDAELVEMEPLDSHIVALCAFQGQIYWGAGDGVYVEKGGKLERFCPIANVYALNATDHSMVAVTENAAFVYDGKSWRGFSAEWDEGPQTLEFDVAPLNA